MSTKNNSGNNSGNKSGNNMSGLKKILKEKIGFSEEQLLELYGKDLSESYKLIIFYNYLNNNKIISKELSSIFNICNMCKNDFNLTQELKKILPKNNSSRNLGNGTKKFYGIVLESSRTKKKIKILKVNNDLDYLVELLLFLKNNLEISRTGMCRTGSSTKKVTLHFGKDMFGKDIKLCIPKSEYIIEKSNTNTNTNIREQYIAGNLVEFVENTNNITKMNGGQGQRGGLPQFIIIIIIVLCVCFVFGYGSAVGGT